MVASSVTPTIYGLTQYTRIFYWVLLPGVRKTDYSGYFKSCFHQLWLSKAVARRKNCRNPNALNLCSEWPKHKRNFHENKEPCTKILLHNTKLQNNLHKLCKTHHPHTLSAWVSCTNPSASGRNKIVCFKRQSLIFTVEADPELLISASLGRLARI